MTKMYSTTCPPQVVTPPIGDARLSVSNKMLFAHLGRGVPKITLDLAVIC